MYIYVWTCIHTHAHTHTRTPTHTLPTNMLRLRLDFFKCLSQYWYSLIPGVIEGPLIFFFPPFFSFFFLFLCLPQLVSGVIEGRLIDKFLASSFALQSAASTLVRTGMFIFFLKKKDKLEKKTKKKFMQCMIHLCVIHHTHGYTQFVVGFFFSP